MMDKGPVDSYGRARVYPGKHGLGDYRVEISGVAPTHGELLFILHWIMEAEDRYPDFGRRLLWYLINDVYEQRRPIHEIAETSDAGKPQR